MSNRKEPRRESVVASSGRFEVRLTRVYGGVDLARLAAMLTEAVGGLALRTLGYDGMRTNDDDPASDEPAVRQRVQTYQVEWSAQGTLRLAYTPFDRTLDIIIESDVMSLDQGRLTELIRSRYPAERLRARLSSAGAQEPLGDDWMRHHPGVPDDVVEKRSREAHDG